MEAEETTALKAALSKRVRKLERQAQKGSPSAKHFLCFFKELNLQENTNTGIRFLNTRAELGEADAQCVIGMMYEDGLGVKKDPFEALRWYEKAVAQKHAIAQCILGVLYSNGIGVEKDERKAFTLYQVSAEQDNPSALLNLGIMYEEGEAGLTKDENRAIELYERAAQQGYAHAEYSLALIAENRGEQLKALQYYTRSAAKGHAPAQTNLGVMYEHGTHVPKDERKALQLYEMAAAQGDTAALYNAAIFYEAGKGGTIPDVKKACEYHARAALKGDANAQVNYGYKLCVGEGVVRNYRLGAEYLHKAMLQQERQGYYYLASLYDDGTGIEHDHAKTIAYFKEAARVGDDRAAAWLVVHA